jgi:hypothetical protein
VSQQNRTSVTGTRATGRPYLRALATFTIPAGAPIAGLVDEILVHTAPYLLGGGGVRLSESGPTASC